MHFSPRALLSVAPALALSTALAAALTIAGSAMPLPAAAAGAVAPYCISTGGGGDGGGYRVSRCEFFDYQQCLQAATGGGANCVQNLDYRGGASPSTASRARR